MCDRLRRDLKTRRHLQRKTVQKSKHWMSAMLNASRSRTLCLMMTLSCNARFDVCVCMVHVRAKELESQKESKREKERERARVYVYHHLPRSLARSPLSLFLIRSLTLGESEEGCRECVCHKR